MNKDDYYLRVLRPLWREICRSLRYEVDFLKFCTGLFQDKSKVGDDITFTAYRERYVFRGAMLAFLLRIICSAIFYAVYGELLQSDTPWWSQKCLYCVTVFLCWGILF